MFPAGLASISQTIVAEPCCPSSAKSEPGSTSTACGFQSAARSNVTGSSHAEPGAPSVTPFSTAPLSAALEGAPSPFPLPVSPPPDGDEQPASTTVVRAAGSRARIARRIMKSPPQR